MNNNISEEVFYEEYKPIKNHYDPNAAFDGHMFETYGEEVAFVVEQSRVSNKVWTIIESEGKMYICAGFRYVNRVGYMITEKSWNSSEIEVALDDGEIDMDEAIYTIEEALKGYIEDSLSHEEYADEVSLIQESWYKIRDKLLNTD